METVKSLPTKRKEKSGELYVITPKEKRPIKVNSHCVIFGNFNATHNTWNCSHNSTRLTQLKDFADLVDLEIIYPDAPTSYGHNSQNTLDLALIGNFNFPFTIASLAELSSDHNPVLLNFSFSIPNHQENPRAITTFWPLFMQHLNKNILLENYINTNNPNILENKITNFTEAVCSTHSISSQTPDTPNRTRKLFQSTLNPFHKTETDCKPKLNESSKTLRSHMES
ncbi:hypothetical protein TNCV_4111541 [Trichonephila clavipes]|nr:hypothetical protein TNCV_4111541 [Trichonephila clavipes]